MRSPAAEDADTHKSGCPHRIRICPAKRCITSQNVKRHFPGVFNRKNTAAGERENRRRPTEGNNAKKQHVSTIKRESSEKRNHLVAF